MQTGIVQPTLDAAPRSRLPYWLICLGCLPIVAILVWQGLTSHGSPDPTVAHTSRASAIFDISVLVFREGLETILVLAAITAGLSRRSENKNYARPIFGGAVLGVLASIVTWFVVRGIVSDLTGVMPALALQAATGLLAVIVLLVVMNWFFHKVYWGGWITLHNRRKKELIGSEAHRSPGFLFWGLILLGLSSVYREGFEIVLFLQSYYLKLGHDTVYLGALIGAALTALMAALTFWAHQRLPYRRMLIFTGVLLGLVLLVMVGEEAQEMQLAHWIPTSTIKGLDGLIPDWAGVWFSLFPTWETLLAQVLAAIVVVGSYFISGRVMASHPATETAA